MADSLLDRFHSSIYDLLLRSAERRLLGGLRKDLLEGATGRVLEIGGGTGANLAHYPREGIDHLDIVEPSHAMANRLERRTPRWSDVHRVSAEELPFEDDSFDFAVGTLVFCTVPDAGRGFSEVRRVLSSGSRFVFIEHVRSNRPRVEKWQDRLDGLWCTLCAGCHPNRRTVDAIEGAGFEIERLDRRELEWQAGLVRDFVWGRAVAR